MGVGMGMGMGVRMGVGRGVGRGCVLVMQYCLNGKTKQVLN